MRLVSYQDRKRIAAGIRAMYTAATVDAAELALKDLDAGRGTQPVRADAGLVLSRAFAAQGTLRSLPADEG